MTINNPTNINDKSKFINPATEEKQDGIILAIEGLSILGGGLTDTELRATPVPTSNSSLLNSQTISIIALQSVNIGATSAQSALVNAGTGRVIISATVDCWVNIGSNPTSAAHTSGSGFFLVAGSQTYPISVTGGTTKVSVIQDSASGYLSITEIA